MEATLIQQRQQNRMRSLTDRMHLAELPLSRGLPYPSDSLLGGSEDHPYVRPAPAHLQFGTHLRRPIIYNPLYRTVNRPSFQPVTHDYSRISSQVNDNGFLAGRMRPMGALFTPGIINEGTDSVAQRISQRETLFETHQNLEGGTPSSSFLRNFTGNVWNLHSTANPLAVALSEAEHTYSLKTLSEGIKQAEMFHNTFPKPSPKLNAGQFHNSDRVNHSAHIALRLHDLPLDHAHLETLAARSFRNS